MALKLGEVHSEDTRSFFMESSSQQKTPSLCTGTNMLKAGGADLACCKPSISPHNLIQRTLVHT